MSTTNWPRTDSEISFTGAYTCTHHNDAMRAACPVCFVATLTAERDRLRAEVEKVYSLVTPVGFDLPGGIFETAQAVIELTAERDQLRADCENETKWAAHYLAQSIADKARAERAEADAERHRLVTLRQDAELVAEGARLDYLLRWHPTFNSREDIDRDMNGGAK